MKRTFLDFFRHRVTGKELVTDEVIYLLEEGRLEGSYTDRMFFSDLIETESGLEFNMTTITREMIYYKNSRGERVGVKKDFTGTSVFHYELASRKSTDEMTGFMRCLSSTVPDHTMHAVVYGVYNVRQENGELCWQEEQLFYRDMPGENNGYRSVAFDSCIRFYLEETKLRFEYLPFYWDVNPVTMEKTVSEGQYPAFVSKEQ